MFLRKRGTFILSVSSSSVDVFLIENKNVINITFIFIWRHTSKQYYKLE